MTLLNLSSNCSRPVSWEAGNQASLSSSLPRNSNPQDKIISVRKKGQPIGELPSVTVNFSPGVNPLAFLLAQGSYFRAPLSGWRYRIRREISNGGFATVYEAECLDGYAAGQHFAMKVDRNPLSVSSDDQGRLLKVHEDSAFEFSLGEAEVETFHHLWAHIKDDNPVAAVTLDEDESRVPFLVEPALVKNGGRNDKGLTAVHRVLVMQLLGKSVLSSVKCRCRRSDLKSHICLPKSPVRFLSIARSSLRALEFIHSQGLIHRDVKSANFCFKDPRGIGDEVCIIDFGFCRRIDKDRGKLTESFVGTPDYASHQALRGQRQRPVDDLESLGYTFLELYIGRLPWDLTYLYEPGVNGGLCKSSHINPDHWTPSLLRDMSNRRNTIWGDLIQRTRDQPYYIPLFIKDWMSYIWGLDDGEPIDYGRLDLILKQGVAMDHQELLIWTENLTLGQRILLSQREAEGDHDESGGEVGCIISGEREAYPGLESCEGSVDLEEVKDSQGSWGGSGGQGLSEASIGSNGMDQHGDLQHNDGGFEGFGSASHSEEEESGAKRGAESGSSGVVVKRKMGGDSYCSGVEANKRSKRSYS